MTSAPRTYGKAHLPDAHPVRKFFSKVEIRVGGGMDRRYERFCLADQFFYDSPTRSRSSRELFAAGRDLPRGWLLHQKEVWTVLAPANGRIPLQGWKIHLSATLDNAENILDAAWEYCVSQNILFKFLTDRITLLLRNAKYADRSGSGKFVTIYPEDTEEFERTLMELGAALEGLPGPYILSDARWGAGPLYVRYGGFAERYCKVGGDLVPAVAEPSGQLVRDRREPGFTVPSWVEIPNFLASCVARRNTSEVSLNFPFQIERVLHHSNGGGVYLANDTRTGEQVVLKEARPFAGLDTNGLDAVQRLAREHTFLKKLSGTGVTPQLYDYFVCWEHHFLVEEYIEGQTLGRACVARYPLIHPDVCTADIAEFTQWALDVVDKVDQGVRALHRAGIIFGDLHPHNIMVQPDGRIRFIDLELGSYSADQASPALGAPGYVPTDGRTGAEADLYSLACLRLGIFLPLTALLPLDPAKARMLSDSVERRFPVPHTYFTEITNVLRHRQQEAEPAPLREKVANLAAGLDTRVPDWPALRDSIRDGILASATPQRTDRLFPGDIDQFTYNGIGLAYGAAGVLYALARSGAGRFPDHEQWLLDAVRDGHHNGCIGFYDGLHGVAYALAELGRHEDALAVLEQAIGTSLENLSTNLFSGLSGVGLNLLHFAALTGDRSLLVEAVATGERLTELNPATDTGPRAGLLYGLSGQALLYVRLFEATGSQRFLTFAETALRHDLDRCMSIPDGTMQVNEGWRVMPYIATGSAGVGIVIHEFLRHRQHDEFAAALSQIRRAAEPEFIICSGLFNGRAGLIMFLAWLGASDPVIAASVQPIVDRHLRRLAWHIMPYRDCVAFPGDQLTRLSMDLATGSAGVLLALSAALDENGPTFPVLGSTSPG
jgi:serine/threonine protein kinase